jgi:hypothetical protein
MSFRVLSIQFRTPPTVDTLVPQDPHDIGRHWWPYLVASLPFLCHHQNQLMTTQCRQTYSAHAAAFFFIRLLLLLPLPPSSTRPRCALRVAVSSYRGFDRSRTYCQPVMRDLELAAGVLLLCKTKRSGGKRESTHHLSHPKPTHHAPPQTILFVCGIPFQSFSMLPFCPRCLLFP